MCPEQVEPESQRGRGLRLRPEDVSDGGSVSGPSPEEELQGTMTKSLPDPGAPARRERAAGGRSPTVTGGLQRRHRRVRLAGKGAGVCCLCTGEATSQSAVLLPARPSPQGSQRGQRDPWVTTSSLPGVAHARAQAHPGGDTERVVGKGSAPGPGAGPQDRSAVVLPTSWKTVQSTVHGAPLRLWERGALQWGPFRAPRGPGRPGSVAGSAPSPPPPGAPPSSRQGCEVRPAGCSAGCDRRTTHGRVHLDGRRVLEPCPVQQPRSGRAQQSFQRAACPGGNLKATLSPGLWAAGDGGR